MTLLPAYFGEFGGQFVPESLIPALDQLEQAFVDAQNDPEFHKELASYLRDYLGRPTPLTECSNLPLAGAGRGYARIFLKREDLVHGGAHKTNQVIGQALLAKRMGKTRIIAETGAGQHGTATALACALLGLDCVIYMGEKDVARQQPNVYRMQLMGAKAKAESDANADATTETMRAAAAVSAPAVSVPVASVHAANTSAKVGSKPVDPDSPYEIDDFYLDPEDLLYPTGTRGANLSVVPDVPTKKEKKEKKSAAKRSVAKRTAADIDDNISDSDELTPEEIEFAKSRRGRGGQLRSEERRVGKECRSRWSPYH